LKKRCAYIIIILLAIVGGSHVNAKEQGIGFEVRPILPPTQIDRELGYYYVQTSPGKTQNIDLNITNTSDKEIELDIIVENGITQSNGNLGYSNDLEKIDKSLKQPITELLKPENDTLTVGAGKNIDVSFKLTPPNESYEGVKVGQIIIKPHDDKEKKGVSEVYQYALGFVISENGEPFNDGNQLVDGNVKAAVINGQKVISFNLVNPEPKMIENLAVEAYVTENGEKIKEVKINNFSFAPNSKVDFLLPWGLANFKPGEYIYHYSAKNSYDSFNYEKKFTIRGNDAKNLNNETAFSVVTPTYLKIVIVIINVLIIVLFIVIIIRNNKWIKQIKKQSHKKKTKGKGRKK